MLERKGDQRIMKVEAQYMEGITISEREHSVVITVDTDVVERWRVDRAMSLLESDDVGYVSDDE